MKILVPVDLSAATVHVCSAAADLARALNGRLVIVHAVPPLAIISAHGILNAAQILELNRETRKAAARKMQSLRQWFSRRCPLVKVFLHEGDAVRVIMRTVRQTHPDYIVIGSHGHGAVYDLLIGSTAHQILRKPPCPVVLVPITKQTGKTRKASVQLGDSHPWMKD